MHCLFVSADCECLFIWVWKCKEGHKYHDDIKCSECVFSYTVLLFLGLAFSVLCYVCRVWTQLQITYSWYYYNFNVQNFSNIYNVKKNWHSLSWGQLCSCLCWLFFNCDSAAKSETLHHLRTDCVAVKLWVWLCCCLTAAQRWSEYKGWRVWPQQPPSLCVLCSCCWFDSREESEGHCCWWWWWCGASELAGLHNIKRLVFFVNHWDKWLHWYFFYLLKN